MQQLKQKPVIWMAGDSIMQSYSEDKRPFCGWGEKLLEMLECKKGTSAENTAGKAEEIRVFHREDSPFETQKRYEGQDYIVDNCAMAGRSSKTFREEGRLEDIEKHIQPGDYLIVQFGHNDSAKSKTERYVSLEDFEESMSYFVNVALEHGATPILASAMAICPCPETQTGEVAEISSLLPKYGLVMKNYAEEQGFPYIDMNKKSSDHIKNLTFEEAETLYITDHVHLCDKGAGVYASLAAEELRGIVTSR